MCRSVTNISSYRYVQQRKAAADVGFVLHSVLLSLLATPVCCLHDARLAPCTAPCDVLPVTQAYCRPEACLVRRPGSGPALYCLLVLPAVQVYCLPDNYEVVDRSLDDIRAVLTNFTASCTHHHLYRLIVLPAAQVYCLPDNYEVVDRSLDDIRAVLNPSFNQEVRLWVRQRHIGCNHMVGFMGMQAAATCSAQPSFNQEVRAAQAAAPFFA